MSVVKSACRAEDMQRRPALDPLGRDEACTRHQRSALVELVGDRVVGGGEAGGLDLVGGDPCSLHRIAELADKFNVFRRVDQLELFDRRPAWGQEMAVLDE